ncbi:MAG: TetR/AcrR family transcriptional regulator [Clostridia bacterium]|nr:TetR/AcrR family transcriptional regulator [Clostridia bacterium]
MATRKEQAALAKGRLMQAAKDLIAREGYDKITIADITAACNMSVGNFYHYFKSKGELITVMEQEPFQGKSSELQQMKDRPILEQLCFYIDYWIHLGVDTYGLSFTRQWFTYHVSNPTTLDDPQNKDNLELNNLRFLFAHAIEKGELAAETPVEAIVQSIVFTLKGGDFHFTITGGEFNYIAWGEDYCKTILPLLLAPWYVK